MLKAFSSSSELFLSTSKNINNIRLQRAFVFAFCWPLLWFLNHGSSVCEVMMKHCMVLARIAVYKEPCQPHCDPRQYGPSGLCHRRPHERARHSLDERWGEVVQHRPDVHHPWGPALGDLLQVPWLECNIMGLYRQCYTLYVWMVLLKEGSTEALWITSTLACTPIG